MLAIAHRGAPRLARENTLESLRAAHAAGADWIEVDVRASADGVPFLLHDPTLTRGWGVFREISAMDAHQVAAVEGPHGERIPTLVDGLLLARDLGTRLLLDLTSSHQWQATRAAMQIAGLALDAPAFTGDPVALAAVRADVPTATILMTWEDTDMPGEEVFDAVRPQFFNQHHTLVCPRTVRSLKARRLPVCVYTVDDPEQMRRMYEIGVTAVISNDIHPLVRIRNSIRARTAGTADPDGYGE